MISFAKGFNPVVIPSQIRSIHSLSVGLINESVDTGRNPFSNQVNSLVPGPNTQQKYFYACRNPFSNQVNSLLEHPKNSISVFPSVVIPSQIRSIHSRVWSRRSNGKTAGRNPFSNQVNSLSMSGKAINDVVKARRNPFSNQVNSLNVSLTKKKS